MNLVYKVLPVNSRLVDCRELHIKVALIIGNSSYRDQGFKNYYFGNLFNCLAMSSFSILETMLLQMGFLNINRSIPEHELVSPKIYYLNDYTDDLPTREVNQIEVGSAIDSDKDVRYDESDIVFAMLVLVPDSK